MISGLRGRVQRFGASRVFLLAGHVEYEVHVPLNVFEDLQLRREQEVFLHIYHLFTSEEQRLYGFSHPSQREAFGAILSLKGFGSVLALSVLSHLDLRGLLDLCERGDVTALTRIPKVGKKTAESLVFEVNQRKARFRRLLDSEGPAKARPVTPADEEEDLARMALLQLGYKEAAVQKAFDAVRKSALSAPSAVPGAPPVLPAAELIRLSLRLL